jgi:hypothetical protein
LHEVKFQHGYTMCQRNWHYRPSAALLESQTNLEAHSVTPRMLRAIGSSLRSAEVGAERVDHLKVLPVGMPGRCSSL